MRVGTVIFVLIGVAAGVGLVVSARRAGPVTVADGRRVYRFACWGGGKELAEMKAKVVDPINAESTDVRVEPIHIPSDYGTKLCTMIAGDTPPELFYLSQEYVAAFADQGALMDLTDLVAADGQGACNLGEYYASVLAQYRYRGRLYGLPWIAQPVVLYCNARRFREAGVKLPDRSWRWRQLVEAGKALTKDTDGDGRTDRWGFVLNGWPPVRMWIWQNGGELVLPDGRLRLTDPRVTDAVDAYAGLIHRDRVAPPLSVISEAGFAELFRAGKVAMFMGGAADDLDRTGGMEVAVREVPAGPGGVRATFAWSAGLHISAAVTDRREAFAVYKKVLERMHRWKVPAPRRPMAARLEEFEPRKARAAAVIRASMEYMRCPVGLPRQVEFDTLLREEFEEPVLRTGRPAADVAPHAASVLERLR